MRTDAFTKKALALDPEARALLAETLVRSLDSDQILDAWDILAKDRADDILSGKVQPVSLESIIKELQK